MYIYTDQNQCRCILKYAYCLWSVCQPLWSRKQSIEGAWPCSLYLKSSQCQLASPSLRERNKSCLSKHILLPSFLCNMALASRCVLSVPFPELAYNRTPLPRTGCSLWKRKETPQTRTSSKHFNSSSPYSCHHVWAGVLGLEYMILKKYTLFVGKVKTTKVQTKVQLLVQCEVKII